MIRKVFVVLCDAQNCRERHIDLDDDTEVRARNSAINDGWARIELRDRLGFLCPDHTTKLNQPD